MENIQIGASPGQRDGQRILRLKGPLNIQTIFDFQTAVRAESSPVMIIDFTDVPFVDSAGLGALVGVHLSTHRANRKLAVAAMNTKVKALLDMSNLSEFFQIYPTIHDAEAAVF